MSQASYLDKRCLLLEARYGEVERKAEESRSNLKSKGEAEGDFIHNLASGRNHGRWNAGETWRRRVVHGRGRNTGVTAFSNGRRDRNVYALSSIIPPGFGTGSYRGVARRGTRGGKEWGS